MNIMDTEPNSRECNALFGGDYLPNELNCVQFYLFSYYLKLCGHSSRDISEMATEEGHDYSHTYINNAIQKGKTTFESLNVIIRMIDEKLNEQDSYNGADNLLRAIFLSGGVPENKLDEAIKEYHAACQAEKLAKDGQKCG